MIDKIDKKKVYSVYEIAIIAKTVLEETFPTLWVEGEISNFKHHPSGHLYFSLKDEKAQINVVMFKSKAQRLSFKPENGVKVKIRGHISIYEKSGNFQIYAEEMALSGIGDLLLALEELKKKLQKEGLFDQEYKKELPLFPDSIGVITAKSGAAVRDIVRVIKRRAPMVEIIVRDTLVQGKFASDDIVKAIEEFNEYKKVDLLIVGRGGGSIEDLWAFNEEKVVRAIFNSGLPIISAVGHEIDYTLSDFVADKRAPTPSAAAEIAVPDVEELKDKTQYIYNRLESMIKNKLKHMRKDLDKKLSSKQLNKPQEVLKNHIMQVDFLYDRWKRTGENIIENKKTLLSDMSWRMKQHNPAKDISFMKEKLYNNKRLMYNYINRKLETRKKMLLMTDRNLNNLSPKNILKRGYSIVWDKEKIVRSVKEMGLHDRFLLELKDGKREIIVTKTKLNKSGGTNGKIQ